MTICRIIEIREKVWTAYSMRPGQVSTELLLVAFVQEETVGMKEA